MGGNMKDTKRNESGEIMLESSIILLSILALLMALLSLSFMFYQQAVMTTIASETAENIAKNYKFVQMDMKSEHYNLSDTYGIAGADDILGNVRLTKLYGTTFAVSKVEDAHEIRSEKYVKERLTMASFGFNAQEPQVDCDIFGSGIGRLYVKVTVSQKTDFFLSGALEFLGIADKEEKFEAVAYAECSDLIGYTSMVNFTKYSAGVLSVFDGVGDLYVSVKGFFEAIGDW